jgi:alkanesulfonate monooxygenase SsuD/methylene tetrahydromethanopterin reductase-like flavin-dependent oxidoreductase (luciferase family)
MGRSAAELAGQARLAEQLGYESFWLPENHFTGDGAIPDPLMLLAAVAAATEHIRLATTSYLLPLRHPLQAAEQVAVLDQLSQGRVILGVGRGFQANMFSAFNVARHEKREIFEWCLATMRRAWAGESITDDEQIELAPRPVQSPHPPVWVAAFGPNALRQAGRLGLPYLASPVESMASLRENYARHREACTEAGAEIPREVPVMRTVFVSNDRAVLARVRTLLEDQARQMRSQPGAATRLVPDSVDEWALVGEPEAVVDHLARYREEVGVTHLIATRLRIGGVETEQLESSLRLLAETIKGR